MCKYAGHYTSEVLYSLPKLVIHVHPIRLHQHGMWGVYLVDHLIATHVSYTTHAVYPEEYSCNMYRMLYTPRAVVIDNNLPI